MGAIVFGPAIDPGLGFERSRLPHAALFRALVLKRPPALRTGRVLRRRFEHLGDLRRGEALASASPMSRPRPLGLGLGRRRSIGLERDLGRGGGRAEEALRGLALLVTELLFQPGDLLGQPVNLPLLLQTEGTVVEGHYSSRSRRIWRWTLETWRHIFLSCL